MLLGTSLNTISLAPLVVSIGCDGIVATSLKYNLHDDEENSQHNTLKVFDKCPQWGKHKSLSTLSQLPPYNPNLLPYTNITQFVVIAYSQYELNFSHKEHYLSIVPFNARGRVISPCVTAQCMLFSFPFDPGSCMLATMSSKVLKERMVLNLSVGFPNMPSRTTRLCRYFFCLVHEFTLDTTRRYGAFSCSSKMTMQEVVGMGSHKCLLVGIALQVVHAYSTNFSQLPQSFLTQSRLFFGQRNICLNTNPTYHHVNLKLSTQATVANRNPSFPIVKYLLPTKSDPLQVLVLKGRLIATVKRMVFDKSYLLANLATFSYFSLSKCAWKLLKTKSDSNMLVDWFNNDKILKMFCRACDNYLVYICSHELEPMHKTLTNFLSEIGTWEHEHLPHQYNGSASVLIVSLSSLAIVGNYTEFQKAILWLYKNLSMHVDAGLWFQCYIAVSGEFVSANIFFTHSTSKFSVLKYEVDGVAIFLEHVNLRSFWKNVSIYLETLATVEKQFLSLQVLKRLLPNCEFELGIGLALCHLGHLQATGRSFLMVLKAMCMSTPWDNSLDTLAIPACIVAMGLTISLYCGPYFARTLRTRFSFEDGCIVVNSIGDSVKNIFEN